VKKRKSEEVSKRRYISCGNCIGGLVRVECSPGQFAMRQCQCMLAFKAGGSLSPQPTIVDGKALACGESAAA
jgi:hypothetical protein